MFIEDNDSEANFKVIDKAMDGEVAWVKHLTAYDPKPSVLTWLKKMDNGRQHIMDRATRGLFEFLFSYDF